MLNLKENKGLTQASATIDFKALGLPVHVETIVCNLKQEEGYLFTSTVIKARLASTFAICKN